MKRAGLQGCVLFCLWLSALVQGQERLRLIHAGLLTGRFENGEAVRELSGDVFFRQDSTEIRCDHALQFVEREQVRLTGRVTILDPPKQLNAEDVLYFEPLRDYQATGKPQLQDSSRTLMADTLFYREQTDHASARSQVLITEQKRRIRLQGQRADYWRSKGYALVTGRAIFTEMDSTQSIVMTVSADSMEMLEDGERYQLSGQVHIHRDSINAYCGRLTYWRQSEKLRLFDHPRAERGADVMHGQEMEFLLHRNKISGITLLKQSVVISRVDTMQSKVELYDLLTGDRMDVALLDQQISSVNVKGQATSYYHVFEDKVEKGMNKAIGDEIQIFFKDGEMQRIKIMSNPGISSGIFYPPEKAVSLQTELTERLQQARNRSTQDKKKRRDGKR